MLVKKFEASTIQDALALVKNNLGPDAIILSAKEHKPKFGIGGSGSIEITAAISEGKLKVKEFAESKLSQAAREVFKNAPVQKQRDFIDKTLRSAQQEFARKSVQFTQQRYVDIQDEEPVVQDFPNINEQLDNQMTYEERGVNKAEEPRLSANNRIKSAVQEAWRAVQKTSPSEVRVGAKPVDNDTIESLKNEIKMLKQIINNFNNVPQNFISLHPGAVEGIPYELSYLYEHLKSNGINSKNSTELVQKVKSSLDPSLYKKKPYVNAYLAKYFLSYLKVCEERYEGKNHLFLGPHSQGKTSSLIKFASELVIKSKQKIAVVSLDTKKIGASDQLKIFCKILNVPFASVKTPAQLSVLQDRLYGFDHVLLDFAGTNMKSIEEMNEINLFKDSLKESVKTHYVQSILVRDQEAINVAKRFKSIGFDDVIYTHLDEPKYCGMIYNFQNIFDVPAHSFSIGSQIPEDFEAATKERFVDLLFNLSNRRKEEVVNG